METGLIVAVVLVFGTGFFVCTEFAVARLRPTQPQQWAKDGKPGAKSAQHAVDHIDAYLSACQLGITVCSLGLGAVGKPAFEELLDPLVGEGTEVLSFGVAALLAFSIITVAHVVLGELAPKSYAIARTERAVLVLAPLMRAFYLATKPLVDFFNLLGNLVLKPFGVPPPKEAGHAPHSEDEIRELLRASSEGGLIEAGEAALTDRALVFGDVRAREVMHPRSVIDHVSIADGVPGVARTAVQTGRTRLPLVGESGGLEDALGVINVKDLLPVLVAGDDVDLRAAARPLPRIPESTLVDEVLRDLRRERHHIALVVDEHGTVTGLLTLEDIIEELVGEIEDEYDTDQHQLMRRGDDGALWIDGAAPVRMVFTQLGLDTELPSETTIGGHVLELLGRMPQSGEVVDLHGTSATVDGVEDERIVALTVEPRVAT